MCVEGHIVVAHCALQKLLQYYIHYLGEAIICNAHCSLCHCRQVYL